MCIKENYFKRKLLLGLATSLLALTLGAQPAKAQLAVDNLVYDFVDPRKSRQDIVLANLGKDNAYVQIKVTEVVLGPDGRTTARTGTPDQLGLLVTPAKLILGPGQRRPVRAVLLRHPPAERIYHISVEPVSGDIINEQSAAPGGKVLSLKVQVGYTVVVFVRPPKIDENLQGSRSGRILHVENRGNVSVMLKDGRQCPSAASGPSKCTALPAERVWPGKSWDVSLPLDGPATYTVDGPMRKEQRTF